METNQTLPRHELELLTEAKLTALLKVCRRQLYKWWIAGISPSFNPGRAATFRATEVLAALERHRATGGRAPCGLPARHRLKNNTMPASVRASDESARCEMVCPFVGFVVLIVGWILAQQVWPFANVAEGLSLCRCARGLSDCRILGSGSPRASKGLGQKVCLFVAIHRLYRGLNFGSASPGICQHHRWPVRLSDSSF